MVPPDEGIAEQAVAEQEKENNNSKNQIYFTFEVISHRKGQLVEAVKTDSNETGVKNHADEHPESGPVDQRLSYIFPKLISGFLFGNISCQ